jgi:ubiquinone/menaquinone biosynthesis C-methylase UbiE
MSIEELKQQITELQKITNDEWLNNLEDRKKKELDFHNRDRDPDFVEKAQKDGDTFEKFYGNKKYYKTTQLSVDYIDNWITENCKGKVCLDYACGNGIYAFKMINNSPKLVIGLDISDISIKNCKNISQEKNLGDDIIFFQADAENTKLPENSIEIVICSGMLHHLDLTKAFPELLRILKPGGKILAIEALDYNPAIKLYRMMTPDMRTEWEKAHILSLKDIRYARNFFKTGEMRFWHVLSYIGGKFPSLLTILNLFDKILTRIPIIQLMAWIFTFELIKPIKDEK